MIYVELKLFPECKIFDMQVDENAYVCDIAEELMCYVGENTENMESYENDKAEEYIRCGEEVKRCPELFSVRKQAKLIREKTLMSQGVRGGDTLVLIKTSYLWRNL